MIAYLHLVFLCFVSVYLLAMLIEKSIIAVDTKAGFIGAFGFVAAVIINEVCLAIQGTGALIGFYPRSLSMMLFVNTLIMVCAALLVFVASLRPFTVIHYSLQINTKPLKITSWKL